MPKTGSEGHSSIPKLPWSAWVATLYAEKVLPSEDQLLQLAEKLQKCCQLCTTAPVLPEEKRTFPPYTLAFNGKKVGAFSIPDNPGTCRSLVMECLALLRAFVGHLNARNVAIRSVGMWHTATQEDIIEEGQDDTCHEMVWGVLEELYMQLFNTGETGYLYGGGLEAPCNADMNVTSMS